MPWCPSCKCEYEEGIVECADCHIELVNDIKDAKIYKNLIKVTKEESTRIVDYLAYSNITDVKVEQLNNQKCIISVNEDHVEAAIKLLNVYLVEEAKENQTDHKKDYYINEYETEELESDEIISDLKSSYIMFLVVGIAIEIVCLLNLFNVINLFGNSVSLYMFLAIGLFFIGVGINTKKRIPDMVKDTKSSKDEIDNIVMAYENVNDLSSIYKKHKINEEDYDEGALYFVIVDLIKKDLKKQFPDTKESIINTAAEMIYGKL